MKEIGMNDWLINTISDLYTYFRKGYASQVFSAFEEVTGKKPITFAQFAEIIKKLLDKYSNRDLFLTFGVL
jgi:hypothetical protein